MSDWTNIAFALMSAYQKPVCITIEHFSANEHKSTSQLYRVQWTNILFSRQDLIFSPGIFSINDH